MRPITLDERNATGESPRPVSGRAGLSRQDQAALLRRWHRNRDCAAREALISSFTPLAYSLARRYNHTSEPYEDRCQVAQLGLVKAIDGYDPDRGFPFPAYAIPTILGELRRYFRNCSWSVHAPRGAQERALLVRDAEQALSEENGRAPTVSELAEFMELSTEQVLDALLTLRAIGSVSLDAPRGSDAGDEDSSYAETIGFEDSNYELVEAGADVISALRRLDPAQRELLRLRFFEELTQSQIARRIGVSQMQVSRLLKRCLDEVRELAHVAV